MKKVFLSVPMHGRKREDIDKSVKFMSDYATHFLAEEVEIIDSFIDITPENFDDNSTSLWCLGESLKRMADADFVLGVTEPAQYGFNGCSFELLAASYYGKRFTVIPITTACPDLRKKKK